MNIAINISELKNLKYELIVEQIKNKLNCDETKIYLMVDESCLNDKKGINELKKEIFSNLKSKNVEVTDVLAYNKENKTNILNIMNFGYIIDGDTDILSDENRQFYSKARIGFVSDIEKSLNHNVFQSLSEQDLVDDIKKYYELIKKHLEDPITVQSIYPSIEKTWHSSYSVSQYFTELPTMPVWKYIYLNNYSNLDSLAIRYFGAELTFRQLFEKVDEYAKSLKKSGVKEDDVVTICMPNTPEAVIAFLAVNKIGATASMLHPLLKADDILDNLEKTGSKYMVMADMCYTEVSKIIDKTNLKKVSVVSPADSMPPIKSHPLGIKMLYIAKEKIQRLRKKISLCKLNIALKFVPKNYSYVANKINKEKERLKSKLLKIQYGDVFIKWADELNFGKDYAENILPDSKYEPYKTKVLLRTGGTTGKSKIACLSNENIISNTSQLRDTIPFYKKGDELLAISPIFHGFGLVDSIITALAVNMSVDLHPQYNKSIFISSMLKNKPTLILGVPTLWKSVINDKKLAKADLSFAKVWISGGDTLESSLREKINEFRYSHNVSTPIMSGIGSTEGTAAIGFTGLKSKHDKSVGFPLPLNNIKILNPETLEEVKQGEVGIMYVNGPTVMNGYYKNKVETDKTLVKLNDGKVYLNTGDMCYMTENGEICFEDRNTNIIIVSGVNVYASEIESVVKQIPEVSDCAVVKMPHDYKMNVPVVFVTLRNNIELNDEIRHKIMKYVNSKVDTYQKIYEVIQLEENNLPLTNLNKVNRKELQNVAANVYNEKKKENEGSYQKKLRK